MANIPVVSNTGVSYLSVAPFHNYLYEYTRSDESSGSLTIAAVTATDCPAGRILRETGRKLFSKTTSTEGIQYVSVYDSVSGIHGFIHPNSPCFSICSERKDTPKGTPSSPGKSNAGDAIAGTIQLYNGSATVISNSVQASSVIMVSYNQNPTSISACGILNVTSVIPTVDSASGSFSIGSFIPNSVLRNATPNSIDNSLVNWYIVN